MVSSIPNDVFQYSTYTALTRGFTSGKPRTADLTTHGTYGIGVYEDGSPMLLLDSTTYKFRDGKAGNAPMHERLCFTMVTIYAPTFKRDISPSCSFTMTDLDSMKMGQDGGVNSLQLFSLDGRFEKLKLEEGTVLEGVVGRLFGFVVPEWMEGICGPRVFCHAVLMTPEDSNSNAKENMRGGRVTGFETKEACLRASCCGRFHLGFPMGKEWDGLSLM
ncbi:alpha-acetolactate decarboxylase [Massarina eburnea CBS 473.64]|uniref:Alpha-acetolactate decarboxylase n=1 Tax=Massarina eburnea CBS 473.64 TaxID=1395130 RepID=A0A6A6SHY6_9PLEO|nr:alpha-acetolactate decarboxylase [Massarina eburnea CBS 473.64]